MQCYDILSVKQKGGICFLLILKKHNGFTLIEITMSVILIPLLWFAMYISLAVNTMLISQAKHRAQAVFIAQQNLDRMRIITYADLFPVAAQAVTIDNRGTVDIGDDLAGTMDIILGELFAGGHFRQITVRISWNENTVGGLVRTLTESLATIVSDDPAG